jgi:hypothetical protein
VDSNPFPEGIPSGAEQKPEFGFGRKPVCSGGHEECRIYRIEAFGNHIEDPRRRSGTESVVDDHEKSAGIGKKGTEGFSSGPVNGIPKDSGFVIRKVLFVRNRN